MTPDLSCVRRQLNATYQDDFFLESNQNENRTRILRPYARCHLGVAALARATHWVAICKFAYEHSAVLARLDQTSLA